MNELDIAYNTEREHVRFPEYGRSIQEMVQHALTIEHPQKRQKTVETIISLMIHLGPQGNRNMDDYRDKLWNQVFEIANYELDVTPPPGINIRRREDRAKPEPIGYPTSTMRFRHYGNGVHRLIEKAIEMPDGAKKEGLVEVIGSYMKLAYKTWNKEHYVSDDIVKEDLELISGGRLELHEGYESLDRLAASAKNIKNMDTQSGGVRKRTRGRGKKNKNGGSGNNNGGGQNRGGNSNNNSGGRRHRR